MLLTLPDIQDTPAQAFSTQLNASRTAFQVNLKGQLLIARSGQPHTSATKPNLLTASSHKLGITPNLSGS
jgi:D-alanyl-D-alanine carboxypeptidase